MSVLPPGSYLALSHLARDVAADARTETFGRLNPHMAESVVLRTREEVAGLFGRLQVVEPGVVQVPQWHPDPDASAPPPTSSHEATPVAGPHFSATQHAGMDVGTEATALFALGLTIDRVATWAARHLEKHPERD